MSLPFEIELLIHLDLHQVRGNFLQICGHFVFLMVHIQLQLQDLNLQLPHKMEA